MSAKTQTAQDSEFCDEVWQVLKSDSNDLRKQRVILEAHRKTLQAAIAAHSAFIREAAGRDDVVETGDAIIYALNQVPQPEPQAGRVFTAMLDQIERTPDEG